VAFLLDTNVAIHLRDGDPMVTRKVAALQGAVLISVVTRVELEGGVYRERAHAPIRRARLDAMLSAIPALAFDDLAAKTYEAIVAGAGYSRRKLLDRMIAAQALVHRATLVTFNQDDFSDIPGLSSLVWPSKKPRRSSVHQCRARSRAPAQAASARHTQGFIPEEAGRGRGVRLRQAQASGVSSKQSRPRASH
jgi:tRNA(fMet)-specific endonuclease VapC